MRMAALLKAEKGFYIHTWSTVFKEGTGPSSAMKSLYTIDKASSRSEGDGWTGEEGGY